ncbi:MAG: hypothetical protein Q8R76_10450 [Candidatus Omnitrophota bacterium]|nr:hypothetical protein [Candidatus Omnitrophota bacterium]
MTCVTDGDTPQGDNNPMAIRRFSKFSQWVILIALIIPQTFGIYYPVQYVQAANVRMSVQNLSQQEVNNLAAMYQGKEQQGLYESDPGYKQEVYAAAGAMRAEAIRAARNEAQQIMDGKIQSTFLSTMKEFKKIYAEGAKDPKNEYAAHERVYTEAQVLLESQLSKLKAEAAGGSGSSAEINRLEQAVNGAQIMARMFNTAQKYEDLSAKNNAAASDGSFAKGVDFASAVAQEFIGLSKEYSEHLRDQVGEELGKRTFGGGYGISNLLGPGGEANADAVLALENKSRVYGDYAHSAARAADTIGKLNTAVQTIDGMINNKDFDRIQKNEYLGDDAKGMAQVTLAAGKAVQGIADLLGAELGNVPAQIFKDAGKGIELIGASVELGARLEESKLQGGKGGISGEYQGALEDFKGVGLVVREGMESGGISIPNGTGNADGYVNLSNAQLAELRNAVSAFTSLMGRNPTKQELARLAAGGSLDVGLGRPLGMSQLADPHKRTDYDIRGAERREVNEFLNNAIAGVPPENLMIYDPETGERRTMTREELKDKLDEMNALSQSLYGKPVDPSIFGADLMNGGAFTEKMRKDIFDRMSPAEQLAEKLTDPDLSEEDRLRIEKELQREAERDARAEAAGRAALGAAEQATQRTAQEAAALAAEQAAEEKAKQEEKQALNEKAAERAAERAVEEKKEVEREKKAEEDRKAEQERKAAEDADKAKAEAKARAASSGASLGPRPGCTLFGGMIEDDFFDSFDNMNRGTGRAVEAMEVTHQGAAGSAPAAGEGHHHEE